MGNFSIHAGLVNGDLMPIIDSGTTASEIVIAFTGDDTGAPPASLTTTVTTESGEKVEIVVPNSSGSAVVKVDGHII